MLYQELILSLSYFYILQFLLHFTMKIIVKYYLNSVNKILKARIYLLNLRIFAFSIASTC